MSTKDNLLRAAISLFASRGVAATTTREIATEAGVSEGAIYRHFTGKERLVEEIFTRHAAALAAELDAAQELPPRNGRSSGRSSASPMRLSTAIPPFSPSS